MEISLFQVRSFRSVCLSVCCKSPTTSLLGIGLFLFTDHTLVLLLKSSLQCATTVSVIMDHRGIKIVELDYVESNIPFASSMFLQVSWWPTAADLMFGLTAEGRSTLSAAA